MMFVRLVSFLRDPNRVQIALDTVPDGRQEESVRSSLQYLMWMVLPLFWSKEQGLLVI